MTLILVLETPFVGAALLGFSGFLLFSRKLYISYKLLLINVGTQFMCFQSFCSLKIPMCGRDWKRTQLAGQVCSHLLGLWQTVWAFQDCTRRESIHITTHTCPRQLFYFNCLWEPSAHSARELGLFIASFGWVSEVWGFRTQSFALIRVLLLICPDLKRNLQESNYTAGWETPTI